MRLPITRLTPLECLLWAGAGLLWAVSGGVPGASLLGLARQGIGLAQFGNVLICHATDPAGPVPRRSRSAAFSQPAP